MIAKVQTVRETGYKPSNDLTPQFFAFKHPAQLSLLMKLNEIMKVLAWRLNFLDFRLKCSASTLC